MAPGGANQHSGEQNNDPPVQIDWDEVEAKYWASMHGSRNANSKKIDDEFEKIKAPLESRVVEDTRMILRLNKEEDALRKRLAVIEQERLQAQQEIQKLSADLKEAFLDHREQRRLFEEDMDHLEAEKRDYFRKCRASNIGRPTATSGPGEDASSDFGLGGPVRSPEVKPLSDNGPHQDGPVQSRIPQAETNGHDGRDGQGDIHMSDLGAGDDQSEGSPQVAEVAGVATAQQTSRLAHAQIDLGAPAVAEKPPTANGHPERESVAETTPAEQHPADDPTPIEAQVAQATSPEITAPADNDEVMSDKLEQATEDVPEVESKLQLREAAEISASATKEQPLATDAAAATTDDVLMKDVTVVIRERELEAQPTEPAAESSAPDVTMATEPTEAATTEVSLAEETARTPKASRQTSPSVVVADSAADAEEAEPPQAASPASSLSSLTSSFADLDEPESPTIRRDVVEVLDQNQQVVGQLRPLGRDNRSIAIITRMPIKRQVRIRSGRNFSVDDLEKVHHPSDQKGAKWVSMYIQAVGDVQQHPCDACAKKTGVYQDCIMVNNENFLKCGNCEWNRHACLGAGKAPGTSRPVSRGNSRPSSRESATAKPANRPTTPGGFSSINQSFSAQASKEADTISVDGDATPTGIRNSGTAKKPARTSLPTGRKAQSVAVPSRPASPATPVAGSPVTESEGKPRPRLPAIAPEILCLRDDGTVFTDPPLMRGVPLDKIGPDHPYWDPSWDADISSIISKELKKWTDKYNEMERLHVNDHRKYEAKRQVNRGNVILEWLEKGELHPYQLVGKKWMNSKKLIKYNTLFRLAQMLFNELPQYKLMVKPSDWMRHRLHELSEEDGDEFQLATHVAGFYHDPKVQQVREDAGFTSVGRPHKASSKKAGDASTSKSSVQRPLKRKEPPTEENTPKVETPAVQQQPQQQVRSSPRKIVVVGPSSTSSALADVTNVPAGASNSSGGSANVPPTPLAPDASEDEEDDEEVKVQQSPAPSRIQIKKKIRLTTGNGSPTVVPPSSFDLAFDGYTSTDSCSNDTLHEIDWRVNQIKTPEVSTNPSVTQYWHFVGSNSHMLEHQVLKQLKPAKWAVFRHPYDFHLRYKELSEIVYATQSIRVIIRFRKAKNQVEAGEGRGDMLAEFKRDRTKRRFLRFMASKGVKLLRSSKDYVENAWTEMEPEFNMPGNDSE